MDQSKLYTLLVGPYVAVDGEQYCAACAQTLEPGQMVVTLMSGPQDDWTDDTLLHSRCARPLVARLVQGEEVWP